MASDNEEVKVQEFIDMALADPSIKILIDHDTLIFSHFEYLEQPNPRYYVFTDQDVELKPWKTKLIMIQNLKRKSFPLYRGTDADLVVLEERDYHEIANIDYERTVERFFDARTLKPVYEDFEYTTRRINQAMDALTASFGVTEDKRGIKIELEAQFFDAGYITFFEDGFDKPGIIHRIENVSVYKPSITSRELVFPFDQAIYEAMEKGHKSLIFGWEHDYMTEKQINFWIHRNKS